MLTAAQCRDAKPRTKPYELTCAALPGFLLRVLPTGKKSFFIRYRLAGKDRRERLGLLSRDFTVEDARRMALRILAGERPEPTHGPAAAPVDRAFTPAPLQRPEPEPEPEPPMTVRELVARFERDHIEVRLKAGTAVTYRHMLRKHILPNLGHHAITDVKHADVEKLHASLRSTPGAANYTLCVIRTMYSRAIEDWELCKGPNPAARVPKFPIDPVERFLTPEERRAIEAVLVAGLAIPAGRKGHIAQAAAWAIRLLALTGMRRDEVCDLEWTWVDWRASCLRLPDSKTGKKVVQVSSAVMALLREIHEHYGRPRFGLVLRSRSGRKLKTLNRTWDGVRKLAGIADVRLHDLRHSAASDAIMSGVPLQVVGKMLGHRNYRTTERYAHIADHVIREAVERTSQAILEATRDRT